MSNHKEDGYCYTEHGTKVHITRGKGLTLCGHPAWGYGPESPHGICKGCKAKEV